MKIHKSRLFFCALFIIAALSLSACKANFTTNIKNDGSGSYIQELGFTSDEASLAGMSSGTSSETFCQDANSESGSDLPPGTTIRQETRDDGEIWCIFDTDFKTLEDLRAVYATTDMQINTLDITNEKMVYDVSLDLSGDTAGVPMGDLYWIVTMPGNIGSNNADEVKGNSLKWNLSIGQVNQIHAESTIGGINLGGDTLWYVVGGGGFLVLCCLVPLVIVGIALFLIRRKKSTSATETPIETPIV